MSNSSSLISLVPSFLQAVFPSGNNNLTRRRRCRLSSPLSKQAANKSNYSSTSCTTTSTSLFNGSSGLTICGAVVGVLICICFLGGEAQGYNDERGILKWNPYWFSNFRYSAPSSYYISPSRVGTPFKRVVGGGGGSGGVGIYKWSPVFFSSGGGGGSSRLLHGGGSGSGYYGSSSRWTPISSYTYGSSGGGSGFGSSGSGRGSRYMTKYVDNSLPIIPRSQGLDLGSNDLSALLGAEMNTGLGLENDAIDVLDGSMPILGASSEAARRGGDDEERSGRIQ